ncbi:DNA adenine methylase [candidate division WOR-3 bacterium]|nr:DNA adenine methylase [candidate division WOR-3 bacterium]MCK4527847.1 DNA adenine methylase [candidate division WOR-3 bacterium]
MRFYSPLRYPGGKNKLAKFVALICKKNNIDGHYVEPYAGGASVALYLLVNGYVKEITINDFDRTIYAFWYSILSDTERFCRKIKNTEITVENWKKFKKIHKNKKAANLFDLGFATFFLNRTNHSGVLDGGVIGGKDQKGKYKINCRFNKESLIERIKFIASYRVNIHLYNLDALDLIKKIQRESVNRNTIFYFDPPYYLKGPSLYMNHYKNSDHKRVSEEIKRMRNARWIVSYDNVPEIKNLYKGIKKKEYSLLHTANEIRIGKEILFFSDNLLIPRVQNPAKI